MSCLHVSVANAVSCLRGVKTATRVKKNLDTNSDHFLQVGPIGQALHIAHAMYEQEEPPQRHCLPERVSMSCIACVGYIHPVKVEDVGCFSQFGRFLKKVRCQLKYYPVFCDWYLSMEQVEIHEDFMKRFYHPKYFTIMWQHTGVHNHKHIFVSTSGHTRQNSNTIKIPLRADGVLHLLLVFATNAFS